MSESSKAVLIRVVFSLAVFAVLTTAIATRVPKRLNDFDQSFYLTIAYDMNRHGVFSNGIFDAVDSTQRPPPPGMFFVPVFPTLILATMKLDTRFARAVECAVLTNHNPKSGLDCEVYARPINIMHGALLTSGVIAIGASAMLVLGTPVAFFVAATLATAALALEAELFSYIMTESALFALFSLVSFLTVIAVRTPRPRNWAALGLTLGVLCLTKPSFVLLMPLLALLGLSRWWASARSVPLLHNMAALAMAFALVLTPWIVRNGFSVGKWGISEEYGSAALVERFSFNTMTLKEGLLAFPYCLPTIGPPIVAALAGPDAMSRFQWDAPGSFFATGRARREALVARHGKLDPVFTNVLLEEWQTTGLRHLLVSAPLAWCGAWVSGIWSLIMLPLFVTACVLVVRRGQSLLLYYAAPAIFMIAVHAAVANHYSRYNLGFIGPLAVGAVMLLIPASRKRPEARSTTM